MHVHKYAHTHSHTCAHIHTLKVDALITLDEGCTATLVLVQRTAQGSLLVQRPEHGSLLVQVRTSSGQCLQLQFSNSRARCYTKDIARERHKGHT
eukprot:scaffold10045_cov23-Tisochrysis_lutea.AAC.1